MLILSIPLHVRRAAVVLLLSAYALPLSLGAVSGLSHGAFHLLERLQERQARAAAMGLVHLSASNGGRSTFTHTHDGITHAHAGPVDALLTASEHADQEQNEAAAPVVKLSAHAPAVTLEVWTALAMSRVFAAIDRTAPDHPRPLPPLPPPRG